MRAACPVANPVVTRYLNDPRFIPGFAIADAFGFLMSSSSAHSTSVKMIGVAFGTLLMQH